MIVSDNLHNIIKSTYDLYYTWCTGGRSRMGAHCHPCTSNNTPIVRGSTWQSTHYFGEYLRKNWIHSIELNIIMIRLTKVIKRYKKVSIWLEDIFVCVWVLKNLSPPPPPPTHTHYSVHSTALSLMHIVLNET